MCSTCRSMRETMAELEESKIDEIMDREEAKRIFSEMEKALEDCRGEK